jgi:hypothetical protein
MPDRPLCQTPASGTLARLSDMRDTTNAFSSGPSLAWNVSQTLPSCLPSYCMLSNRFLAQRTPREMEYHVHGISANDTDAPPNARPLTNNDERAFLHPNPYT